MLPDLNGLTADDAFGWKVYDTLLQLRAAIFCLLVIALPRTYAIKCALWVSAAWYAGQAIDEWYWGDTFKAGLWEYAWLLEVFLLTTIHVLFHGSKDAR